MCGEGKGKGIAVASSSRDQEERSELEYAEEEEGSSSSASYHILLVAPEETLLVFGSPISQTLPSECHDLVSFSLQILQVINEPHDLMTFFFILSHLPHSLSFHYLIKGKTT